MTYQRLENAIVAIQMEVTNACPLADCAECAYRFMSRPIGHMDFELAKTIVDGAVEAFGTGINFNLNGLGDPMSCLKLPDLIRYIGQKAPNGRVELFSSLVGSKERIEAVCKALDEIPNNVLFASTCHLRDDKGNIMEQTAKHFQFDTVFNMLGSNPRIDLHVAMNRSIFTTGEDIGTFNWIFLEALPKDKVHFIERLDPWLEYIRPFAVECSDVTGPAVCDYPYRVLFVEWNGTVTICCTDTIKDELVIGTIKTKEDVKNIWFSPLMEELRQRHNNLDVDGLAPCNRCGRTKGYLKRGTIEEERIPIRIL